MEIKIDKYLINQLFTNIVLAIQNYTTNILEQVSFKTEYLHSLYNEIKTLRHAQN